MKFVDNFLNSITMYRLVLYYLIFLVLAASILGFFGLLPFSSLSILISAIFLVLVCVISSKILSFIFKAPANIESSYITALILSLIITPATKPDDFFFLFIAGSIAMVGKYVLFWKRKHIFNPAAAAVVVTLLLAIGSASWWVGTTYMFPFLLLGVLVVKKIERSGQVISFFAAALFTMFAYAVLRNNDLALVLGNAFTQSPILFFAFIMFTEPQTAPTTRLPQLIYGAIVGFLYSSGLSIGLLYVTPEIALVVGNLFAYAVGMKGKLVLILKEKVNTGLNTFDFIFTRPKNFSFTPGQYMEWTLVHNGADARGNRRYFTIASSPTEDTLRLGVRLQDMGSSFKSALSNINKNKTIVAGQLGGDFILPKDASKKLVFIAGGIGITPFRSIIKYLIDKNEKRDIVLFYANKTEAEVVYRDIFSQAGKQLGLKTIYIFERLNVETIKKSVPDFKDRIFYLSGPHTMVDAYKKVLKDMKIPSNQIITDYFPGYA